MMSPPPGFPLAADVKAGSQTSSGFQFSLEIKSDECAEMSGAITALLLIFGTLRPFVSGYIMQETSMCLFSDDKQGNITYQYWFNFNRQLFLYYYEKDGQIYGCDNCIPQMAEVAFVVAEQLNADQKWMSYFKREGERCKEEVRTFWDKTVERKVKPSVELFVPVQVHDQSIPVLVCHVWGFYPQDISVGLFKNDILVKNYTEAVRTGDWTYNIRATLDLRNFLPNDNYTCLVNHPSLDKAIVKEWKHGLTNIQIIKISVASVVFSLGLVWLITAIVLWMNAKRSDYIPIPERNYVD